MTRSNLPATSACSSRRREDHTTCTAVAPEVVFTVRTYGTGHFTGRAWLAFLSLAPAGWLRLAPRS